jgi:hypothetical protein
MVPRPLSRRTAVAAGSGSYAVLWWGVMLGAVAFVRRQNTTSGGSDDGIVALVLFLFLAGLGLVLVHVVWGLILGLAIGEPIRTVRGAALSAAMLVVGTPLMIGVYGLTDAFSWLPLVLGTTLLPALGTLWATGRGSNSPRLPADRPERTDF